MFSLHTPQSANADIFVSPRVLRHQHTINLRTFLPVKPQFRTRLNFDYSVRRKSPFVHRTYAFSRKSDSKSSPGDDFVTRIIKENPSQVEKKYLVGDKFYTLEEREKLTRTSFLDSRVIEILKKLKPKVVGEAGMEADVRKSDDVHLKDILRDHKGKLYVPEKVFASNLSEEEQFDSDVEKLPRMRLDEFEEALKNKKVKLLTFKEGDLSLNDEFSKDFIVELKEIPGDKNLHETKWVMKLPLAQAETVLEVYEGPRNEIERQTMSVGKLPEYPHPVATSLSNRLFVELGALTVTIAAAAAIVCGFIASSIFAATTFVYAIAVYVVKPTVNLSLKICLDLASSTLERVTDAIMDFVTDGWVTTKIYEIYNSGMSGNLGALKPMLAVLLLMVVVYRLTAARKQKNFSRWDLWQGIEFSQSKAQARVDGSTGVTFKDVAGIEGAVEELQELVTYLKNPELFDKMKIKPPHGVLLEGPPGCGKTLVAKAIAGEAGVPFYQMAGSEFVEILVGVGSARIRDLFKRAQVNSPSVIFIDEIDALATKRQGIFGGGGIYYDAGTQERETTLNQLLTELDGFDTSKGVIFLAATNRRDLLDPALLRPGRFDRKIKIRPPNAKGRLDILKVHAGRVKLSDSVDLSTYAYNLSGWSGAKLAQLLQDAALVAVRKGHKCIIQSDVDDAVDRLTLGAKLVGLQLGHQGQCRRATVEVGTALTSILLRRIENANVEVCDRISIIPHGQTLSQVVFKKMDNEDAYTFEREPQLLHRLQIFLGGRAAEEVIFGRDTSAASTKYLADASWLARKIISVWNLENPVVIHGEHPPWKKKPKFVGPRLDFEGSLYQCYMRTEPPLNFSLDDDVATRTERLLNHMYERTVSLLRSHHSALLKTIKVILSNKVIREAELDYILDNYPANMPTSLLLEESDPGSLPPFFKEEEEERKSRDLEYTMLSQ